MASPRQIKTYRCVCHQDGIHPDDEKTPLLDGKHTCESTSPVSVPRFCMHDLLHFVALVCVMDRADVTISIKDDNRYYREKHCHARSNGEVEVDKRARRKLLIATALCVTFMIGEAVGGILASSLAVATDAAHLLTDFTSFIISLIALQIASRPATKRMSFGWYRAEVMGAIISVLLIWVVTAVLVYLAVLRIINDNYEIGGTIMLITAGLAVLFNIVMGATLYDSHTHSHFGGGSHSHSNNGSTKLLRNNSTSYGSSEKVDIDEEEGAHAQEEEQKSKGNINVRAAFIHVIGDFLQSLGVFVAALIIFFKPQWKIVDPICTFLFSVLVLITTINILRETLHVLMEGTPRGLSFNDVRDSLQSIQGVKELHNLRIWSLTVNKVALSVHLAVEPGSDQQKIVTEAAIRMRDEFDVVDCTSQVEEYVEEMESCKQCKDPAD